MPKKRVYRKRRPAARKVSRRYRRRRVGYRRSQLGNPRIGFPSNRLVKMRYVERFLLNPTNSGVIDGLYQFRANSIFDPNFTGTGHQPLGHDQWSLFYNNYTVIGSKLIARFRRGSFSANNVVGVTTSNASSLLTTNLDTIMEQGLTKYSFLSAESGAPQETKCVTIRKGWSAKKFFNIQSIKDNQFWLGAKFGANPGTDADAYFQVWAATAIGGGDAGNNIEVYVTIDYMVLLSEPNNIGGS